MKLELLTIGELQRSSAQYIAEHLCRPSSEMQAEFRDQHTDTPVVVAVTDRPISWVAIREWHGEQAIEAFTAPEWRRRGLAKAGVLLCLATWHLDRRDPVCVFSPDCVALAKGLGFVKVLEWQRSGSGWALVP